MMPSGRQSQGPCCSSYLLAAEPQNQAAWLPKTSLLLLSSVCILSLTHHSSQASEAMDRARHLVLDKPSLLIAVLWEETPHLANRSAWTVVWLVSCTCSGVDAPAC